MKEKENNKPSSSKKMLKDVIKNEVAPYLIGVRSEMKEANKNLAALIAKEVRRNQMSVVFNGKEIETLQGYTPERGVDYFTDEDVVDFVQRSKPVKGIDYLTDAEVKKMMHEMTPKKGVHYFTPEDVRSILKKVTPQKGKHYFTKAEIDDFIKSVTPKKGVDYRDGTDGETKIVTVTKIDETKISATEIRDKLESLKGIGRMKISAIKDLEERLKNLEANAGGSSIGGTGGEGGGGSSASSFIELTDTPSSYSGKALKGVRVNADANGLEFYTTADSVDLQSVTDQGNTTTNDIIVPDEAYGAGWNGSLAVPTKNALYDKIQTITGLSNAPTLLTTTGNVNNLSIPTSFIVFTGTSAITLSGLNATGVSDGQEITILNNDTTSRSFTITHNSTGSTAANRFSLPNGVNMSLRGGFAIKFKYVATNSRWYASAQTLTATSPLLITGSSLSIPAATDTSAGYLAQADWIAFNGKPNFYSSLIDEGAVAFSNTGATVYPIQLTVDRDLLIVNRTLGGLGVGVAKADVKARIHAKTPPSSTITDVTSASITLDLEIAAGMPYSQTANMDIPYIQRASGFSANTFSSVTTYLAGDVIDYQLWTYDNVGTYSVCAATIQIIIGNNGDEVGLFWGTGTMVNTLGGYKLLKQINGGGFNEGIDLGNSLSYTDTNFTNTDLTISPTASDFVSNGTTWTFTPSGVNLSPTGGIYKSPAGSTYGFYDNNDGNAYRIYHNVYAYSPSTGIYVTDGTNSYISNSTSFYQDTTTFTGISTPPEHYGIQANGSNLNWNINLYERQVIGGRAYYSITPYNLTTTDTNDSQYRYATISIPYFIESTKILMSVDGGADASLTSTSAAQYVDAFNWPFVGDTVITPNNIYRAVQILEQQAESEDDPSALVIKGLNGYQSITFEDSTGAQLAKIIVGTDGSVDFICSSLKVNGTPL